MFIPTFPPSSFSYQVPQELLETSLQLLQDTLSEGGREWLHLFTSHLCRLRMRASQTPLQWAMSGRQTEPCKWDCCTATTLSASSVKKGTPLLPPNTCSHSWPTQSLGLTCINYLLSYQKKALGLQLWKGRMAHDCLTDTELHSGKCQRACHGKAVSTFNHVVNLTPAPVSHTSQTANPCP